MGSFWSLFRGVNGILQILQVKSSLDREVMVDTR
ncbi:hypothetical protein DDB_G0294390 [Dictyostelium discoideum AX4]|nr:hypothetical protein DDB_G0294390 [Dictyostelium discoideum AX4]EAL60288.1 hypothetical protein DDB_G0294390 [Dictyostelium discoideum AX4]|eukprot:XP_628701.1 hypothetical protein DDB_G0294390 [Dictyostelium discoideum AX4]